MYVDIKGLNFSYNKSKEQTLKDFNLEIAKGEIVSILGESGSGKSTVLRLVAGLEVPVSGSIKIQDKLMVNDGTFVHPENRGVGMVFQDYALFPHMNVEGNIKFGLHRFSSVEKKKRIAEVLNLVKLTDYRTRYPHELSGGQQQRVALARALAPRPALLLLDEPFSNLDQELRYKIRDELKLILKQTDTTTIFVTHDPDDARALADKVISFCKGGIVQSGDPS